MNDHSGPAFPTQQPDAYEPGASLRDMFAMAALIGMLAESDDYTFNSVAAAAYEAADAMLAARSA